MKLMIFFNEQAAGLVTAVPRFLFCFLEYLRSDPPSPAVAGCVRNKVHCLKSHCILSGFYVINM